MNILKLLARARKLLSEEEAKQEDIDEKASIAKAFNDRYTYRIQYKEEGYTKLEGNVVMRGGYAWMCPICNSLHFTVGWEPGCGLIYPACCTFNRGGRFSPKIRTR